MALLPSGVDLSSEQHRLNDAHNRALAAELRQRLRVVQAGGGESAIARHRARGKLLARERMRTFGERLQELGITGPDGDAEATAPDPEWGTPDELVTTVVDVSEHVEQKRLALFAHATQMGPEVFFAKIPQSAFHEMFGQESFQLVRARVPASPPETDLFDGLR